MRPSLLRQLRPSALELWYVAFITCAVVLIGNGKLLLERAGLIGSADLIGQQVSTKVLTGTSVVDAFKFTANAVNLVIWGATGLIIYSFLQAVVQSLRAIEYERDVDSGQYIHPQGFTHQAYWREVIADGLLGFILLAFLAVAGFAYIEIVIPDSFAYIHRIILEPDLRTAWDLFVGIDIAFVGSLVVYLFLRLVVRHHRSSAFEA